MMLQIPPDFLSSIPGQLTSLGVCGFMLFVCGYAILKLWNKVNEIQEARISEAKAGQVVALDLVKQAATSLSVVTTASAAALAASTAATVAQTEAVKELLRKNT